MIEKLNYPHIGIFILAWLIADLLGGALINLAHRMGAVDKPHSYKTHTHATPFLGGISVFIAFALAIFSILRFTDHASNMPLFGIIYMSAIVVALGLIDDFRPISAIVKLAVLFVITVGLYFFDVRLDIFPQSYDYLNVALTLVWIVGVTSAVNSLDHMDGSAGGVAMIAAFSTFFIVWRNYQYYDAANWQNYQKWVSYASIGLAGALLGFLRYNFFSPAKMFLGDNGSLLLGFLLASISILGAWSAFDPARSMLVPICILAVPLYDITLSTVLRYKNGVVDSIPRAIVYCGKDHLSHRLIALGFTKREAVLFMYGIGVIGGIVASVIASPDVSRAAYITIALASMACLFVLGMILDKAKVYDHGKS